MCYSTMHGYVTLPATHASAWVGGAHESYLRIFLGVSARTQTAKMAEGGVTPAKCELVVSSVFDVCKKKCRESIQYLLVYSCGECDLVFSSPTAPATPTLKELSNALDSVVNWHLLGVKLDLEDHELRTIEQNYRGDGSDRCKHEVLSRYLRNAKLPTWKAVADALHLMGEHRVAWKIQTKYCTETGKPSYSVVLDSFTAS